MARRRTIAQNLALFVGLSTATGENGSNLAQIYGLQSLNYNWSNPKEDVLIYGQGAPITREAIGSPEVSLDFSYLLSNVDTQYFLGFSLDSAPTPFLSTILDGTKDQKNYFVFIAPDGSDTIGLSGASAGIGVLGIGNGFINSYSIEGAVGSFPTASVTVQGLNIKTYTGGVSQPIPAVNPTTGLEITGYTFTIPTVIDYTTYNDPVDIPAVIKPGDIVLNLASAGGIFHDYASACVQSFNLSFDLNRSEQLCLGSKYAVSRDIQFPINVNFEVEILAKDIRTGSLANFFCQTGLHNANLSFKRSSCTGSAGEMVGIELKRLSFEGQSWNTSVGSDPQTVTTTWVGQIGGTSDTSNGMFMSGNVFF